MGEMEGADVRRDRGMSTQNTTQPLSDDRIEPELPQPDSASQVVEPVDDIIAMSDIDAPSWYQRNSGALPKSEAGMADTHRRTRLPKPENDDTEPFLDRIRAMFDR